MPMESPVVSSKIVESMRTNSPPRPAVSVTTTLYFAWWRPIEVVDVPMMTGVGSTATVITARAMPLGTVGVLLQPGRAAARVRARRAAERWRIGSSGLGGRGRQVPRRALRDEPHLVVGAVAEGLVRGVPAAAEGDRGAPGQPERAAFLIEHHDAVPLHAQRPVVPDDDSDLGHFPILPQPHGKAAGGPKRSVGGRAPQGDVRGHGLGFPDRHGGSACEPFLRHLELDLPRGNRELRDTLCVRGAVETA